MAAEVLSSSICILTLRGMCYSACVVGVPHQPPGKTTCVYPHFKTSLTVLWAGFEAIGFVDTRAQVEQVGEARVLFKTRRFSTFLHVDEDGRDPENLVTSFALIRSVRPPSLPPLSAYPPSPWHQCAWLR